MTERSKDATHDDTREAPPPLQKSIRVRCSLDHAFAVFTARIDLWWPPSHRKFAGSELRLEPRTGGRFFERAPDGREATLGEVLTYDPPARLVYAWVPGSLTGPTHVEVRFSRSDDSTLVEVTHSAGLASDVFAERVALFERAWSSVLPAFVSCAERTD
jgi:uncharacterized protein YndB with AHSA1/START domain